MAVHNEFDLANEELLTVCAPHSTTGCKAADRASPAHLFVLFPYQYNKSDKALPFRAFEAEAISVAPAVGVPGQSDSFAHRFTILACGPEYKDKTDVNLEWTNLLAIGDTGNDPKNGGACAGYKQALFVGQSFIHLRNHYSINGLPMPDGAADFETVGQVLASTFGARLDKTSASSLLEVWRSAAVTRGLGTDRKHISFYTTNSAVLDQLAVREGDEIYVRSIPKTLR